jgi:hypothetical protein
MLTQAEPETLVQRVSGFLFNSLALLRKTNLRHHDFEFDLATARLQHEREVNILLQPYRFADETIRFFKAVCVPQAPLGHGAVSDP